MKKNIILLSFLIGINYAQQDTIIYNSKTHNYDIYYTAQIFISEDSTRDTTLHFLFTPTNNFIPHIYFWIEKNNPFITKLDQENLLYVYGLENDKRSDIGIESLKLSTKTTSKIRDVSLLKWDKWHTNEYFQWSALGWIKPGYRVDGFILESNKLPSIGFAYCEGYSNFIMQYPDDLFPKYEEMEEKISQLYMGDKYLGVTINTIIPALSTDFVRIQTFIDTLIRYKHEAMDLGWIGNKGTVNSLDKKLENAKKQIDKGNNKSARNILNAFLNELEALYKNHRVTEKGRTGHGQGPPFITDEAYALLKYNAEYLIEQLK